ncbi:MAG TPA: chromosomal replication initiator protein DnaA [Dehalococcoidales bacterium]|nr:chromosomal replication initiator protein DnaA [Dehalococcoidales bacterium]
MNVRTAPEIWETALGELQLEVNRINFQTWFYNTTGVCFENGIFTVGVPNTFIGEYLEKNQKSLIERTLAGILQSNVNLNFCVRGYNTRLQPASLPLFNPRYTFDTFVVGDSNNLAFAAAEKIIENPGRDYNPLFVHGGHGLGKTHLLHAIGNMAITRNLNVLCVSAENYTNEMITAIREKTTDEFRRKYRALDILLVDDIQFIAGKEQTEESFYHTFNELHGNNKQIVVSCDRSPRALTTFKERLRSRFEWGLVADLQPPDFKTRVAVLKAKAARDGVELQSDVIEYIALQIKENIRQLEGSLNRVVAYSKLLRSMVTPEVAARALDDLASKKPQLPPVTPGLIIETVAGMFQTTLSDIKGRRRDENTAHARQICMYLMREETEASLTEIGKEIGGRSPATISYAHEKVTEGINNDPQLRRQVFNIRQQLHISTSANNP